MSYARKSPDLDPEELLFGLFLLGFLLMIIIGIAGAAQQ
jgi:hypothetical protein